MADYSQLPIENIWSTGGDMVAPTPAQQQGGWGIQSVPRQWWNWKWNLHDTNLAYLLQKGIPEWTSTQEYIANKSFCTRGGFVYKAVRTHTGSDPAQVSANWVRAFADYTTASSALGGLTPREGGIPFFISATGASVFDSTAYGRGMLNVANASAARSYISAQESSVVLSNLSTVTRAANTVPYFNTDTSMATFNITAFGRGLVNAANAENARNFLGLANSAIITADPANRAHTLVYRDAAGNFNAGVITATLSGNATTANKLRTPVTINGVAFDGSQNIVLPGLDTSYAGTVARLHINGANLSSADKTTQLALRNKSDNDWISLAVVDDNTLQFVFRSATNPVVQIGNEVILHTGNQFSLGPTLTDARSRLGLDRLTQGSSDTQVFPSTLNNGPYLTVQPTAIGGFNGSTNGWLFRFDANGNMTHGTVPAARITGLSNSAQIPATTTAQANSLVQRDADGGFSAIAINAYGTIVGYGSNIFSRASGTGNAHIGFQRANGTELGLIWGAQSNNSMNFRVAGGATAVSITGLDMTVTGRVNATTLNASGNVNATGSVNVGSATLNTAGNITGAAYGAYGSLTNWVDSVYAKKGEIPNDIARAGAAWDAVGQYILAGDQSGGSGGPGTTRAGSQLKPYSTISYTAGALPAAGTYRCMGAFAGGGNQITLWQRIS
ncbi:putative autotransporter [Pseudomonas phage vB_PaeM_C2-10_Ab02]|uniref:Putative autotransporter n=1 Tax=Pseudomonas phage vB_PaeM_C2-10_Ab02 TaxID=1548900 RepID=A0A0A1IV61_9CAUD|nr:tail fiber protein [Pseudomonas phage vB_PaeM_C2-10_Ab02]CEF89005.1 putative autotransporter [Pseudomonas phage vB_PaeM_C2-10_Ab02]